MGLAGKTAVVTGGSSGMGRAIAKRLASVGAAVAVVFRQGQSAADEVCTRIHAAGGHAVAIQADVADPSSVRELFGKVQSTFGTPDMLVNAAGIFMDNADVADLPDATLQRMISVNLYGPVHCCREFVSMRRAADVKGGRIINITSGAQFSPNPHTSPYGMAKAAVGSLTKSLALEAAPQGITVNNIAPGFTATEMNETFRSKPGTTERLSKAIPLGRPGTAEEVAALAEFLLSEDAGYITGATVAIDGGLSLRIGGI